MRRRICFPPNTCQPLRLERHQVKRWDHLVGTSLLARTTFHKLLANLARRTKSELINTLLLTVKTLYHALQTPHIYVDKRFFSKLRLKHFFRRKYDEAQRAMLISCVARVRRRGQPHFHIIVPTANEGRRFPMSAFHFLPATHRAVAWLSCRYISMATPVFFDAPDRGFSSIPS